MENCQPRAAATYLGKNPTPSANYPFPHPLPLRPLKASLCDAIWHIFLRKVWTLLPGMVTGITCVSSEVQIRVQQKATYKVSSIND